MFGAFVPRTGERPPNTVRSQVKISAPGSVAAAPSQNQPMSVPAEKPQTITETRIEKNTEMPAAAPKLPDAPMPSSEKVPIPVNEPIPPAEPIAPDSDTPQTPAIPDYVIVGEAFNCYVIVQLEDRLLLIDKHAAHERILFDQLCENLHNRQKTAQVLMFPLELTMTEAEIHALEEYREKIEAIGFGYRMQGTKVLVSEIPTEIARDSAPEMLVTLAGRLAEGTGSVESTEAEFFEARLYQASCKAAIKGGRVYSLENIKWLCDRILCVPEPGGSAIKTCPHGRPVAFEIRKNSIERQFSRLL